MMVSLGMVSVMGEAPIPLPMAANTFALSQAKNWYGRALDWFNRNRVRNVLIFLRRTQLMTGIRLSSLDHVRWTRIFRPN